MAEGTDENAEIVGEFLAESDQYLQTLNKLLLKAEELLKNGESVSKDDINAMFRAAHTIKGTSSFLSFSTITHLTHQMETILDRVRNDTLVLTVPIIDVLFFAFDTLNALLDKLRSEGNDTGDIAPAIAKIETVLNGGAPAVAPVAKPATPPKQEEPVVAAPSPAAVIEPVQEDTSKMEDLSQYIGPFIEDTEQNIEKFNAILLAMEKKEFKVEFVNEMFRIAHTIKGSAGVMKRRDVEKIAHRMEDLMSGFRERGQQPDDATISLLFKGIDWIKARIDDMHRGDMKESDVSAIVNEFDKLNPTAGKSSAKSPINTANQTVSAVITEAMIGAEEKVNIKNALLANKSIWRINVSISAKCGMKSMKAMLLQERMVKIGGLIKATMKDSEINDSSQDKVTIQYLVSTVMPSDEIRKYITLDEVEIDSMEKEDPKKFSESAPQPAAAAVKAAPAPTPAAANKPAEAKSSSVEVNSLRVDTKKLDNLMNLAGELVITRARFGQLVNELIDEVNKTKEISIKFQEFENVFSQLKKDIREVSKETPATKGNTPEKLNKSLETIVQTSLIIKDSLSMKSVKTYLYNLDEATSSLDKLSSDIQNGVMQTRMVQIEGVFTRFKRLVRDISKDVNKDVQLIIHGEETELDKKIVDELGDPLTHMIRNSIDHGMETKEERAKTTKPPIGTVTLRASHKGNSICIEVSDDGRGLDGDRISQKAIEKGLYTAEQIAQMSDREKYNIVFAPGFSTAEKVTGLSGRGVGMDVVKKMIESLNGSIDIITEKGKGTTFLLKIPLTLAIIQALLVVVDEEIYAIPLESVSEIVKVTRGDIYSIDGNATIKLREHALSLVNLTDVIHIQNQSKEDKEEQQVVVVTDGEELIGVSVDKLIGEDEIVIKSLPDHFALVKGISGASILGNGRIALILDVGTIMREAR